MDTTKLRADVRKVEKAFRTFRSSIDHLSDVEIWMEMREFRNRIAHDYLPAQLEILYIAIGGRFAAELTVAVSRLSAHVRGLP